MYSSYQLHFFTELKQKIYHLYGKQKDSQELQQTTKKNGAVRIRLPALRLYYEAIVTKTLWHWNKKKYRSMVHDRKPSDKPTHLWVI